MIDLDVSVYGNEYTLLILAVISGFSRKGLTDYIIKKIKKRDENKSIDMNNLMAKRNHLNRVSIHLLEGWAKQFY